MAKPEQLKILKMGSDSWNRWRQNNPAAEIDLSGGDFSRMNLEGINLRQAILTEANFYKSKLYKADLREVVGSSLGLVKAGLFDAYGNIINARSISLCKADLREANFSLAYINGADLREAILSEASFCETDLTGANLSRADLVKADFFHANLNSANLSGANLTEAFLVSTRLNSANLDRAIVVNADLTGASMIEAKVDGTLISGSLIYGINIWGLRGEFAEQKDLIISGFDRPNITVDNIKLAQFIYLIYMNEEIRSVINTLTVKTVLILGRFSVSDRKKILNALREKLREYDLVPIVFDFDRPADRDFTETIKTLAGLSFFVIADITNPKSAPLELQATVPDYQVPFVPIIQTGEMPFSMMADLQSKYHWVLDTISYDSIETLIKALKPGIIEPAILKHNELRLIKDMKPRIKSIKDFTSST